MSQREKAKAKAQLKDLSYKEFEKRTGIRDESVDFNMDTLIT